MTEREGIRARRGRWAARAVKPVTLQLCVRLSVLVCTLVGAQVCGLSASAAPTPLTQIARVLKLTNAQAALALPVILEGTVTFVRPQNASLFLTSGDRGIYVNFTRNIGLEVGDRVRVTGVTGPSFRPRIMATRVKFLGHGELPKPVPATYTDLIHARLDCRFVTITGQVLEAAYDDAKPHPGLRIPVRMAGGDVEVILANAGSLKPGDLLGAEIRVNGTASGAFDSKMQLAGIWIDVAAPNQLTLVHPAKTSVWNLPTTPISQVGYEFQDLNESRRVKIAGTLTYFEPGSLAIVQNKSDSILVETRSTQPLHAGDAVEATGFPDLDEESIRMVNGQLRGLPTTQSFRLAEPKTIGWDDASAGRNAFDLVSMEGDVVAEVKDGRVEMYILRSAGHLFSASLRQSSSDAKMGLATGQIEVGSHVRVTGICFVDSGDHWRDRLWFDIRMRSPQDVALLELPSWWTVERLIDVVGALALLILAAIAWVALLGHKVREQTMVLAQKSREETSSQRRFALYEQRRGVILEMISRARPLGEIIDEVTGLVSFRLHGAHCWAELNEEWGQGGRVTTSSGFSVASEPLLGSDGESLGVLNVSAAFQVTELVEIKEALSAGARLLELAITTQRLYQDLRHRSEYDLLTDIPNRFSFERQIAAMLAEVGREGCKLGLVYVDLDHFKDVNDRYGHRVGDLVLQHVAQRMKQQLRAQDVLARIGGDEFIALIPGIRSRGDAEEIVERIERCFDAPLVIEGYTMPGAASVGLAVAPDDGLDKEELQRAADMAMYLHKEQKKQREAELRENNA